MSDITKDDLRVAQIPSQVVAPLFYGTRRLRPEEFDRLAREQGYMKLADAERYDVMTWLSNHPGKAFRALLTDECDCEDGYLVVEVCGCGIPNHESHFEEREHADCRGRGWLPKPGVTELTLADLTRTKGLFVPSDWLEADNE